MKAPISLCMIVKNEEVQLEKCLQSIKPFVEEICIVDTGSTDRTPEIARSLADRFEVYTGCNNSEGNIESFSDARQRSFAMATQPWTMWIDGDDEVRDGDKLLSLIASHDPQNPISIMLPYEYAHDAQGNVTTRHYRERIVAPRFAFRWVNPVHEVLIPVGNSPQIQSDDVTIVHHRGPKVGNEKDSQRNLRILKAWYEKYGEVDARQLYYLGLEYGNVGDKENAVKILSRYIELSGWDDEKCMACLKIIEHHLNTGKFDEAIQWAIRAISIQESWAECYFALARAYYFRANKGGMNEVRDWQRCIHFFKHGLTLPPTQTLLFINPMERIEIYEYLNFAQNKTGDIVGALESCKAGLKSRPNDGMALNAKLYATHLSKVHIVDELNNLIELKVINNTVRDRISQVLNQPEQLDLLSLDKNPVVRDQSPNVEQLLDKLLEADLITKTARNIALDKLFPRVKIPEFSRVSAASRVQIVENPLDIVLFIGKSMESWCPDTLVKGGIGGSETAAIEMTRRFAAAGHKVRVFGDCQNLEGIYDGVKYLHYEKFPNTECDVFITSRQPHVVDDNFGLKAKAKFCWVHDIHCGNALTHSRALRIDKFLCLSQWHRDFFLSTYRFVHPSQVIQTRNGIDLSRFDQSVKRNPHRAVYSSSPDRGLEVLLRCWPRIRGHVPDAELNVFYGFNNWETSAKMSGDAGQLALIDSIKKRLQDNEKNGVKFHGRINQQRLAEEFLSSGVWAYSTWFGETSCVTAMEAQAAGLRTVTSPIAALNETVGDRGVMIDGDWLSEGYQSKFVDSVVRAMTDPENGDRQKFQQYAKENFSWDSLAVDWIKMFSDVIQEVQTNVIPPYKGWLESRA